jgi:thermitase
LSTIRGNTYASSSGTSMATPQVTGVAALLQAYDPSLDWRSIKNLILAGGDSVGSLTNTITQKRLNAFSALTCANSTIFSRLRPIGNSINGSVGVPVYRLILRL